MSVVALRVLWLGGLLALVLGCSAAKPVAGEGRQTALQFEARVVHLDLEGGFWGLIAADGSKYDPGRLEQRFMKHGLRVRVQAQAVDVASIRMWGTPVRIIAIEPIP